MDSALSTPSTSKTSRFNKEEFKARLREQREEALVIREQKKKTNLERRRSQRKKSNSNNCSEFDTTNTSHCISQNAPQPLAAAFASSEQKPEDASKSVTEISKCRKVSPKTSLSNNRKVKKAQTHNLEKKRAYEREKKRKQREKMRKDPVAYSKYCRLEKERNKKRKTEGKLKSIQQMNSREQRRVRRMWRVNKVNQKIRKQEQQNINSFISANSPPTSPNSSSAMSVRKAAGRKKVKKDRSKTYRELQKTKIKLENQTRQTEKWKKKYQRERTSKDKISTPRKEVKEILKKGSSEVSKQLWFGTTLAQQLKHNASNLRSSTDKQLFAKCISGKVANVLVAKPNVLVAKRISGIGV